MKKIFCTCFITITVLLFFGNSKSYSQNAREIKLNNISRNENVSVQNEISVFLKVDSIQYKPANGLEFIIKIVNNGSKSITIKQPLDYLQIIILNELGDDISVKQAPASLVNRRGKLYKFETFSIVESKLNNQVLSIDSLFKETTTISSKSSFSVTLKIDHILETFNGKKNSNTSTKQIVSGKYRLGITLSLMGEDLIGQIFQANPVSIKYN